MRQEVVLTSTVASPTLRVKAVDFSMINTRNCGRSLQQENRSLTRRRVPWPTTSHIEFILCGGRGIHVGNIPLSSVHAVDVQIVANHFAIYGGDVDVANIDIGVRVSQFDSPEADSPDWAGLLTALRKSITAWR